MSLFSEIEKYKDNIALISDSIKPITYQDLQKDSYAELDDFILLENWYDILYWFSGLSIASIFLLRLI